MTYAVTHTIEFQISTETIDSQVRNNKMVLN